MSKLDDIVKHIGSPYGEGATYDHNNDNSHLDESDADLLRQDIIELILDLIGPMEQQETTDMSLSSWTNEDYAGFVYTPNVVVSKAFGRNELRSEVLKKVITL